MGREGEPMQMMVFGEGCGRARLVKRLELELGLCWGDKKIERGWLVFGPKEVDEKGLGCGDDSDGSGGAGGVVDLGGGEGV